MIEPKLAYGAGQCLHGLPQLENAVVLSGIAPYNVLGQRTAGWRTAGAAIQPIQPLLNRLHLRHLRHGHFYVRIKLQNRGIFQLSVPLGKGLLSHMVAGYRQIFPQAFELGLGDIGVFTVSTPPTQPPEQALSST